MVSWRLTILLSTNYWAIVGTDLPSLHGCARTIWVEVSGYVLKMPGETGHSPAFHRWIPLFGHSLRTPLYSILPAQFGPSSGYSEQWDTSNLDSHSRRALLKSAVEPDA